MLDSSHNMIVVGLKIVKNLGNYESLHIEASAAFVDKDPNDEKAWKEAWGVVDTEVERKLIEIEEITNGRKGSK